MMSCGAGAFITRKNACVLTASMSHACFTAVVSYIVFCGATTVSPRSADTCLCSHVINSGFPLSIREGRLRTDRHRDRPRPWTHSDTTLQLGWSLLLACAGMGHRLHTHRLEVVLVYKPAGRAFKK